MSNIYSRRNRNHLIFQITSSHSILKCNILISTRCTDLSHRLPGSSIFRSKDFNFSRTETTSPMRSLYTRNILHFLKVNSQPERLTIGCDISSTVTYYTIRGLVLSIKVNVQFVGSVFKVLFSGVFPKNNKSSSLSAFF